MDDYARFRRDFTNVSGHLAVAAATDDTTLATGKAGWTIFIQRISFLIETSTSATASFEDSNGTAVLLAITDASPGVGTQYVWDFGPRGKPCTEGKNFQVDFSATGLAGHIEYDGYMKQTGNEYLRGPGTVGTGQVFA